MKVLFVSRSSSGEPTPFVKEQADALFRNHNVIIDHYFILKGGFKGYMRSIFGLHHYIKKTKPDLVHVHYGLSALVAGLSKWLFLRQHKIITTFHGCDLNKNSERKFSLIAAKLSSHNILVSERMTQHFHGHHSIVPCGIDTKIELKYRAKTRIEMGWSRQDFVILFSSSFDRKEKDPAFAFDVIKRFSELTSRHVRFLELKGYGREQLTALMQAADALLLCSLREGSPQVIKESILNSLPIVANDVGDVKQICEGVDNCFIVDKEVDSFVKALRLLSDKDPRIQNREPVIAKFDNDIISGKLFHIYQEVLS
ncbi:glycosyltransferase family 4 protein [Pontibacter indicus]|uniref:Glycosyltransferase involved in cell wall bisynthesis n=1 Tax=Pontibacter indicus TaxID=1317125 RepID=A0A1R3WBP6_9BACT|nr:glycosyltransferase family 4 protein [Pontibacter indicus]SIT75469.1 Glycosyltransferase involved in cell wall bisynthesis [Pontibacter indicus]